MSLGNAVASAILARHPHAVCSPESGGILVTLVRILVVVALNAVPIWGFTQDEWSAGTTLALYWIQSAIGIPVMAVLILAHRHFTHKRGHYKGGPTGATVNDKPVVAKTFVQSFLITSIPFVAAHGIFLGLLLGTIWKDAAGGVNLDDLKLGLKILLNVMAFSFAVDMFQLSQRPFSWIRQRTQALMVRSLVVHMVIILGMGFAALTNSNSPAALFKVFLVLKFLADLSSELPQWEPKRPPEVLNRMAESVQKRTKGGKKGKQKDDEDFATYWARIQAEQAAGFADDEEIMTPAQLKRFG